MRSSNAEPISTTWIADASMAARWRIGSPRNRSCAKRRRTARRLINRRNASGAYGPLAFGSSSLYELRVSDGCLRSRSRPGEVLGSQNVEYPVRTRSAHLPQPTKFFHELTLRFTQPAVCQQYVDSDDEHRAAKVGAQAFSGSRDHGTSVTVPHRQHDAFYHCSQSFRGMSPKDGERAQRVLHAVGGVATISALQRHGVFSRFSPAA